MLHVAAQGDSASSLYFFKEMGLDINTADRRGSTPLHWACFRQSEIALGYLLAWNPNLDAQDVDGLAPLHLAVRFVDQSENTRAVRLILLRGASKTIEEKMGRIPIDLVSEIRNQDFANDVRRMLSPPKALDCLMLSPPTRLVRKKVTNLVVFAVLFFSVILIEVFIAFPFL